MGVSGTNKSNKTMGLVAIIIVIWIVLQFLSKGIFLSPRNLATLCLQTSVLGFVAIGMNVVIILGGIDLSIPSVVGLLCAVGAVLNIKVGMPAPLVLAIMLLTAVLIGVLQGFFVARFMIPAFVVTLAGKMYMQGISLTITKSKEFAPVDPLIRNFATTWVGTTFSLILLAVCFAAFVFFTLGNNKRAKDNGFDHMGTRQLVFNILPVFIVIAGICYISIYRGLPLMAIVLAIFALVLHMVMQNTPFGRKIYAVGANPEAARLSGINPQRMVFFGFVIMSFSYFFGSLASMSRISGYIPGMAPNMELDAIASCVIGGTSLTGGYGNTAGAILGAFLLTSIDNGMSILNVHTFYQYIAKGLILLLAVIIDAVLKKRDGRATA